MSKLNPPILEKTLPAFIKSGNDSYINIPFQLNRSVSRNDFEKMQVLIKTVQSNTVCYNETYTITENDLNGIKGNIFITLGSSDSFKPTAGQYYKIQIAFISKTDSSIGYYSDVGVIKCISQPLVQIATKDGSTYNSRGYVGTCTGDITEKVYLYKFSLYDENGDLVETSGELLHNSENDTTTTNGNNVQKLLSSDTWTISKVLKPNSTYEIGYQIVTINGYNSGEIRTSITEIDTVEPNMHSVLSVIPNFENGYNEIRLVGNKDDLLINGSFVLLRRSDEDDYEYWNEICRFQLAAWDTSLEKVICRDYCLRQGYKYEYAVQAYNNNGLYSDKVYNIEGPVQCDFEDCFLYDGEKQLKIRFNPKVSNFKSTVLESKVDTLGGKYPFIFRNGIVEYKEFSISGLLSLLSDDNGDFFNSYKSKKPVARPETPSNNNTISNPFGTQLTADNYRLEREYKLQALEWLTNGKPKLFRSAAEGNFIVRLMNTSLTPNDTLGRLLHTFTSTAYEIAEYNYPNLKKYNFAVDSAIETRDVKTASINLKDIDSSIKVDSDGTIHLPQVACFALINAAPNISFEYKLFNGNRIYEGSTNLTGVFQFPIEVLKETPLITIKPKTNWGSYEATLSYGYYHTPEAILSHIQSINVRDKIVQQSGLGTSVNIINEYEDVRIKIGEIYYLKVQKKFIEEVTYNSTTKKYMLDSVTQLRTWDKNSLYLLYNSNGTCTNQYIDGCNPPNIINATSYTYEAPNTVIKYSLSNTPDLFKFILNDSEEIDFSGDIYPSDEYGDANGSRNIIGRYEALTKLKNVYNLRAGIGIIMDIVYQEKEITYSIESTNSTIKSYKKTWERAKENYENSQKNGSSIQDQNVDKAAMETAYNNYLGKLNKGLEQLGDGIYVI